MIAAQLIGPAGLEPNPPGPKCLALSYPLIRGEKLLAHKT